jgi:hypothetical protein
VHTALVLCQISIDDFGDIGQPPVASHILGATEGGGPWPGDGLTR